jgi:hypothetical protein
MIASMPWLAIMVRTPAVMFATGSKMPLSASEGSTELRNVVSMSCMRPFDGVPAAAFESQPLTASALPVDSRMMIFLTPGASFCGSPISPSAFSIWPSSESSSPAA